MGYYRAIGDGLLVGYHFEGGENFEEAGSVPLSMETLDNDRVLFLGNEACCNWVSFDYEEHGRLYRVVFRDVKTYPVFTEWDRYMRLTHLPPERGGHRVGKKGELPEAVKNGYRLFFIQDNDRGELHEGFLVKPKESVVSIEDITEYANFWSLFDSINT